MKRVLPYCVLVIVFLAATAAGTYAKLRVDQAAQPSKPGWCCMPDQKQSVVQKDMEACRAANGSIFNWSKDACTSACV